MAVEHREFELPLTRLRQEKTAELLEVFRTTVLPLIQQLGEYDTVERILQNGHANGNGANGHSRASSANAGDMRPAREKHKKPPKQKSAGADYAAIHDAAVNIIREHPGIKTQELVGYIQALGVTPHGMTPSSIATAIKKVLKQSTEIRAHMKEGYRGGLSYFLVGPTIPPPPPPPPPAPPAEEPLAASGTPKANLEFKDLNNFIMDTITLNGGKPMTRDALLAAAQAYGFPAKLGKRKNPLGNAVSQMIRRMERNWQQLKRIQNNKGEEPVFRLIGLPKGH